MLSDSEVQQIVERFKRDGTVPTDAQAMALVRRFHIDIRHVSPGYIEADIDQGEAMATHSNLNRAICECVARLPAQQPADAAGER